MPFHFSDLQTFTNESISGGAVTAYNTAGTPVNLQLRWAKTDSTALGAGHQDTWNLFYQANSTLGDRFLGVDQHRHEFRFQCQRRVGVSYRFVDPDSRA